MTNFKRVLLAATVFGLSHSVSAGTTTWEWDLQATSNASTVDVLGTDSSNTKTLNGDMTAFSDTGGHYDNILQASSDLHPYDDGFGMINQDETGAGGQHAFDNKGSVVRSNRYGYVSQLDSSYTDYDMALVSFDTSVELKEVGFSWVNDDQTDFTVLAYTGSSTTAPTLAGNTWAGISSDWALVGSYRAASAGYYDINDGDISSEYWLIGAFNDILDTGYTNDDDDTDAFKLEGLKGKTSTPSPKPPQEVPEPAALGLMLLGMFGLYVRRNKTNA
jgi:hypothetical protein